VVRWHHHKGVSRGSSESVLGVSEPQAVKISLLLWLLASTATCAVLQLSHDAQYLLYITVGLHSIIGELSNN